MSISSYRLFENAGGTTHYTAGQVLFEQGEPGQVMYVVVEGEISIVHNGQLLDTVGAGGIFGEMALIDNSPRLATAVAKTDCQVIPLTERRLLIMLQESPTFAIQVIRAMSARLRREIVYHELFVLRERTTELTQ